MEHLREGAPDGADGRPKPFAWLRWRTGLVLVLLVALVFLFVVAVVIVQLMEEVQTLTVITRWPFDLEVLVD